MNIEELREFCIRKKGAEECFPFDETTLVFKVIGKVFLITGIDNRPLHINLKCNPEKAIELREKYSSVLPGFHMNKKHWNTIIADHSISNKLLREWIDESYFLVTETLKKNKKLAYLFSKIK